MLEAMGSYYPYDENGVDEYAFGCTDEEWENMTIEQRVIAIYGEEASIGRESL